MSQLAWVAQQTGVVSVIIGPRTLAQLQDNLSSLKVEITEADREAIDERPHPDGNVIRRSWAS